MLDWVGKSYEWKKWKENGFKKVVNTLFGVRCCFTPLIIIVANIIFAIYFQFLVFSHCIPNFVLFNSRTVGTRHSFSFSFIIYVMGNFLSLILYLRTVNVQKFLHKCVPCECVLIS